MIPSGQVIHNISFPTDTENTQTELPLGISSLDAFITYLRDVKSCMSNYYASKKKQPGF